MSTKPETYDFFQTEFVPNNKLPVLVYRSVLPQPHNEETATEFVQGNGWLKGGTWGAIPRHHFHPNTHECYAVFRGSSTLLIGVGPLENQSKGTAIRMDAGDVIILPAGVAHCSKDFQDDYRYIGAYPEGAPKWRNEFCRDQEQCQTLRAEAEAVPVPDWDPVGGHEGHLHRLWSEVSPATMGVPA
ncbi:Fc.00g052390.m01.CDS01 [Cosmosporella sp. VM-42]